MGCAVNGPGEAGDADFGIAGGRETGFIYAHGRVLKKVASEILVDELFHEIDQWIEAGMERPKRLKLAKPAALMMAEAAQRRRPLTPASASSSSSRRFGTIRPMPRRSSHKLLVRGGYIRQVGAGIWTYLPLGWKVHEKAVQIVREEQNAIGGQEMLMPVLTPAELWQATGRYDIPEVFKLKDRAGRDVRAADDARGDGHVPREGARARTASCRRCSTTSRRRSATSRGRAAGCSASASSS